MYITLFLSFIFCSDFSNLVKLDYESSLLISKKEKVSIDKKNPLVFGLYSAILPGMGQYMLNKKYSEKRAKKRAFIFLGVELLSWITTYSFKEKYHSQVSKYQNYADCDIGWNFERWIQEYSSFMNNHEDVWSFGIGDGSHSIEFYYNGTLTSTTNNQFNSLQGEIESYNGNNFYEDFDIEILKDQHFYENIGKYNEFFPGWSDSDEISFVTTTQGYVTARSPIKDRYIESYNKAEQYSDYSEFAAVCVYFNHFVSMLDAFILARKFNGNLMATSSTIYDRNLTKMPIGINFKLILAL